MKRIIDENNFYIGDALDDAVSEDDVQLIDAPPPQGFYRPKWNGENWVDGESAEYTAARDAVLQERRRLNDAEIQRYMTLETNLSFLQSAGSWDALTPEKRTSIARALLTIAREISDSKIDYKLLEI